MIIDNLPAIPSTVTTGDELPIERGTTTYKIDYAALAAAILAKLGGDPVTIEHGGHGQTTAAAGLAALGGVAIANIINNLTSTATNKPLSAAQGKVLNDNMALIAKAYSTSKFCSNAEGTLTLDVPAGKYLIQYIGKTQTHDQFISLAVDDAEAADLGYGGMHIGTNSGNKVITAVSGAVIKTYATAHTIELSYSANWYRVALIVLAIQ